MLQRRVSLLALSAALTNVGCDHAAGPRVSTPVEVLAESKVTFRVEPSVGPQIRARLVVASDGVFGTVTTIAVHPYRAGSANGRWTAATFNHPSDLVADSVGNVYVSEAGSGRVRALDRHGFARSLAGYERVHAVAIDSNGRLAVALAADAPLESPLARSDRATLNNLAAERAALRQ